MKVELFKSLSLVALMALAGPVIAQETPTAPETPDAATTEVAPAPVEENATGDETLSMGEVVDTERQPGTTYVEEVFGDWERKCAFNPDGDDPCQIYQLLKDETDTPTAEFTLLRLPDEVQAAAGATVVVPLETLLTQQLTIAIDGGATKRYPFRFCTEVGCFAQIGLTEGEVGSLKNGAVAKITITPAGSPDRKVVLPLSLTGFTAAYNSLTVPRTN